jgi:hypothetical protein
MAVFEQSERESSGWGLEEERKPHSELITLFLL